MSHPRMTKPGPGMEGILVPAGALLLSGFGWIFFGRSGFFNTLMLIFAGYSLISLYFYSRTRNISYFAAFLFQLLITAYLVTNPFGLFPVNNPQAFWFFYFCGLSAGAWLLYLAITKKARWKGREVFELAARDVEKSIQGFTERPLPVGKVEFTRSELAGLADYLQRNLVALTFEEESTVFFVPVRMGQEYSYLLGTAGHYSQKSWVSFDRDGNVTVKISKKDYYQYVDELEFDRLCEGFGGVFMEFLEDYRKGEELRIMNRLDSTGMNFFS